MRAIYLSIIRYFIARLFEIKWRAIDSQKFVDADSAKLGRLAKAASKKVKGQMSGDDSQRQMKE
jgi:hypothetical protein